MLGNEIFFAITCNLYFKCLTFKISWRDQKFGRFFLREKYIEDTDLGSGKTQGAGWKQVRRDYFSVAALRAAWSQI